jgi:hypothetical protein
LGRARGIESLAEESNLFKESYNTHFWTSEREKFVENDKNKNRVVFEAILDLRIKKKLKNCLINPFGSVFGTFSIFV